MWEYHYPDPMDELYHHGTKGMKWGVRRYQNKDGSLTAAGKKRRTLGEAIHDHKVAKKRKAALEKARAAKAAKKVEAEKAQKAAEKRQKAFEKGRIPARKMTNEELQASVNRLEAEKRYKEAVMATRPMKRLMSKMWSDAIVPGLTEGGKELVKGTLKKYGSDLLGIDEKDAKKAKSEYEQIKEAADIAKFKKQTFQDQRDLAEAQKKYADHLAKEKQEAAQKEVDEYNAKLEKEYQDSRAGATYRMKGDGTNSSTKTKETVSEGKKYIEGETTSKTTALSTVRSSETVKNAEAWVENDAGEALREVTITVIQED